MRTAALGTLVLLVAACGGSTGTASSSARTATAPASTAPSPSPTPYVPTATSATLSVLTTSAPANGPSVVSTIACSGAIGASDPVAVVQLHAGGLVLRDYADTAHPRTVCQFPGMTYVPVLDAHHVLLSTADYYYAIVQVPEVAATWFQLPPADTPSLIGISPDFDQIAYLTQDLTDNTDKVHLVTVRGDVVVASLPNPHGGRCGSPEDSKLGEFSRSAQSWFVLDQPFPTLNSLVVLEGANQRLLATPPGLVVSSGNFSGGWPQGTQPAMALWSPVSETLYYRQGGDVWRWTPAAGAQKFLPGVSWYYPTISADGTHLAYATLRPDGLHNVYLVDLAHGGSPQAIGKGARNLPAFLNSTQLWYRSEGQGICGPGGDQPLIYDLSDGSEAPSIVDFVNSVWPSTSSNF